MTAWAISSRPMRERNEAKVSLSRLGQFIRNKTRIEEAAALPQPETSEST